MAFIQSLDLDFGTLERVFVNCTQLHGNYHGLLN